MKNIYVDKTTEIHLRRLCLNKKNCETIYTGNNLDFLLFLFIFKFWKFLTKWNKHDYLKDKNFYLFMSYLSIGLRSIIFILTKHCKCLKHICSDINKLLELSSFQKSVKLFYLFSKCLEIFEMCRFCYVHVFLEVYLFCHKYLKWMMAPKKVYCLHEVTWNEPTGISKAFQEKPYVI